MNPAGRILFLFLTSTLFGNGQVINSVGFQAGLSRATQTWYYKSLRLNLEKGYRTGLYGAATVDFLRSDFVHITSDIGYCEKGFYEKIDLHSGSSIIPIEMETFVSYLFLNNSLKVQFATNNWLPFVSLGLRVDKLLSYETYNDPRDFHEWIYGFTGAVGIEYRIRRAGIFCMGQYLHDLSSLVDTEPTYDAGGTLVNTGLDITNKAYVINLGLRIYLRKAANDPFANKRD